MVAWAVHLGNVKLAEAADVVPATTVTVAAATATRRRRTRAPRVVTGRT
jgi:hypothetical protein